VLPNSRKRFDTPMRIRNGRVEQVARMLGLSRKGLYLNTQRLGIDRADS
jgi:DNA-binding NtrC family response regulator